MPNTTLTQEDLATLGPVIERGALDCGKEQVCSAAADTMPSEQQNFDAKLVAEFKPNDPAGPAPSTPTLTA